MLCLFFKPKEEICPFGRMKIKKNYYLLIKSCKKTKPSENVHKSPKVLDINKGNLIYQILLKCTQVT